MYNHIDEMLTLTADIAERLLSLKDSGESGDDILTGLISRLYALSNGESALTIAHPDGKLQTQSPDCQIPVNVIIEEPDTEELVKDEPVTEEPFTEESVTEDLVEDEPVMSPEPDAVIAPDEEPIVESDEATVITPSIGAAEMRRIFSLNDLFLFRRALFGGSNSRLDEALECISTFTSQEEVKVYMAALGINIKMPDVRRFIDIVSSYIEYR